MADLYGNRAISVRDSGASRRRSTGRGAISVRHSGAERRRRGTRRGAISVREEEMDQRLDPGMVGYAGEKEARAGVNPAAAGRGMKPPVEPETPPYTLLPGMRKPKVRRPTLLRGM